MFSKTFLAAFLCIAFSAFVVEGAPHQAASACAAGTSTVTVTAAASSVSVAATSAAAVLAGTGNKGTGGKTSGNKGSTSNNVGKGNAAGNNAGKGNAAASASASTATAAAASTSTAAASSGSAGTSNAATAAQSALTLDKAVIATSFQNTGNDPPAAAQAASATSSNNFINFCLTRPDLPITNGLQVKTGSCNPAPMGIIAATTNMPSAKFQFPANGDTSLAANTAFTIQLKVNNMELGSFTNASATYYAAPQNVNSAGNIVGHTHVVIEAIDSVTTTKVTDPTVFAFFKGINGAADANGIVTADVTSGLPAGSYRLASLTSASNHQPVLVAVAQHGFLDDAVYFTVGAGTGNATGNAAASTATTAAAAAASSTTTTTTNKGGKKGKNGRRAWGY